MLGGSQPYCYKIAIIERTIVHMALNRLLYVLELQMIYVNVYKTLIRYLYIYIDGICILSTGYFIISLISPFQLNHW